MPKSTGKSKKTQKQDQPCLVTELPHVPELSVCWTPEPPANCEHRLEFGDVRLCNNPNRKEIVEKIRGV